MRCNILQLLKNLRFHSQGKEMTDADILNWANNKVKAAGRNSQMESFKDKNLSNGIFFLELLSAVEPRVVNWNLLTKGETDEEKRLNATYIISIARKLGCSIFLLPEDIMEVNQKMILTLTAGIMYWSMQQCPEDASQTTSNDESGNLSIVRSASEASLTDDATSDTCSQLAGSFSTLVQTSSPTDENGGSIEGETLATVGA